MLGCLWQKKNHFSKSNSQLSLLFLCFLMDVCDSSEVVLEYHNCDTGGDKRFIETCHLPSNIPFKCATNPWNIQEHLPHTFWHCVKRHKKETFLNVAACVNSENP